MIELFMPVMRPISALCTLEDLACQSIRAVYKINLIDNCGGLNLQAHPLYFKFFELEIISSGKNIGTNAAWNLAWESNSEYVGFIGDDYRVSSDMVERMLVAFKLYPTAGAITASILDDQTKGGFVPVNIEELSGKKITGKGNMGFVIFKTNILKRFVPKIPKEFFVFYGDNWIGYWLSKAGKPLMLINAYISHYHKTDLKELVGYKDLLHREKRAWADWKEGRISLSGIKLSQNT